MKTSAPLKLCSLTVLIAASNFGAAQTVVWDGDGADGVFNTAANWDPDVLPGQAAFDTSAGLVSVTSPITVEQISAVSGGSATLVLNSPLTLQSSASTVISTIGGGELVFQSGVVSIANTSGTRTIVSSVNSAVRFVDTDIVGPGGGTARLRNFGQLTLEDGSSVRGMNLLKIEKGFVEISGSNSIESTVLLEGGDGGFSFTDGAFLDVTGSITGDGVWVFDVGAGSGPYLDVSGSVDITSIDLELPVSGLVGASTTAPVILAEYGSLVGAEFGNHSSINLLPGQRIIYDFNGGTQIAIVPEISRASPLLAALLPLFVARARRRRAASAEG